MANIPLTLDHLVFTCSDLSQGAKLLAEVIGTPLLSGGVHETMGTHNALLNLGVGIYLEVIAPHPDFKKLKRARWFGLDTKPLPLKLSHWVVSCQSPAALPDSLARKIGRFIPMQRGDYRWNITVRDDGLLLNDGLQPSWIHWESTHPTRSMPQSGCTLLELQAEGLGHYPFDFPANQPIVLRENEVGQAPHLVVSLQTPNGQVSFNSQTPVA